jgi:hypothetical protein
MDWACITRYKKYIIFYLGNMEGNIKQRHGRIILKSSSGYLENVDWVNIDSHWIL